jgi:signal peptidase I
VATAGRLEGREVPPPAAPPAPVLRHSEAWVARVVLLSRVLAWLLALAALAVLVAVAVGPRLGLYRMETVLSGSMQPTFRPGDVIIVTPEPVTAVRPGQIISYQIPIGDHHVESHRVVRVLERGTHPVIITKGDNNAETDPWRAQLTSDTAWRERVVIPVVGRLIIWMRQPVLQRVCVLGIPILLAVWWLIGIWRPRPATTDPA